MQSTAPSLFALALEQQRDDAARRWMGVDTKPGARESVYALFGGRSVGDGASATAHAPGRREAATAAECGSLGTNGKSADSKSAESGNLLSSRARRYRMQRQAQRLLPQEGVYTCSHKLAAMNGTGQVLVIGRAESGSVGYRGIHTCGSVWHCPVCANKISERRRAELQSGIAMHHLRGGRVYMLTLTYPHDIDLPLAESLAKQAKALKTFKASRQWRSVRERIGYVGSVRALEVTHGINGWHPHTHELIFADGNQDAVIDELLSLRDYWGNAVAKAGLGQINEHGFMVGGADKAADYVAKFGNTNAEEWDVSREMTRQHSKLARRKGRTPFALLHDSMQGDEQASALFVQYATEFKGKRQLYYSPGLRDYLGLDDIDDADIASEDERDAPDQEPARVIWHLDKTEWQMLCRQNLRGEFLDVAQRFGTDGCFVFLQALKRRHRGLPITADFINPENIL